MKEIKKETYKNIEITCYFTERTNCFSAISKVGSSHNEFDTRLKNFCYGFETPVKAIENCKTKIDEFLKIAPTSYKELAEQITNHLTWTGYEECHVDEQVLKLLVESFITARK